MGAHTSYPPHINKSGHFQQKREEKTEKEGSKKRKKK